MQRKVRPDFCGEGLVEAGPGAEGDQARCILAQAELAIGVIRGDELVMVEVWLLLRLLLLLMTMIVFQQIIVPEVDLSYRGQLLEAGRVGRLAELLLAG